MPSSSRSLRDSSPTFGMSRVISSGPRFVSRRPPPVADDGGVLVVTALPAHEGDQDVAAEGQLAAIGRARVGERIAPLDAHADVHDRALVGAGAPGGARPGAACSSP